MTGSNREPRRFFFGSALALLVLVVSGCSDQTEPAAPAPAPPPAVEIHQLEWLRVTDHVQPDLWLASRAAHRDLSADDQQVADIRRKLDLAALRYRDHPRMIANRAVQLEGMLAERQLSEPAPRLIDLLTTIAGETRHVESFGALCQQYYNLRLEGLDQAQALETLKHRNSLGK
jgi:hypothetical protein